MKASSENETDLLKAEIAVLRARLARYEPDFQDGDGNRHPGISQATISSLNRSVAILESITDAFFALDDKWRFTYVNREAERMLLRSREDLVGKNVWQEYAPAVGTAFHREYLRARRENTTAKFEEYYAPLGAWFEVSAYPLPDGLAVFFKDVTGRKLAEASLLQRESELRTILDKIPVIISSIDRHGRFRRVNRAYEEIFGRSQEDVAGRHVSKVSGEPHTTIAEPYVTRALNGESVSFESSILDREGKLRAIRLFYLPQLDANGDLDGFIAMAEDVTERKESEVALLESETRFRSFFNLAAAGMSLARVPDGRFMEVNEKLAQMLGYAPDELLQKSFLEITHPDDHDLNNQLYSDLVEHRISHFEYEKRFLHRNGDPVWVHVSVSAVCDDLGLPLYTIGVIEDIGERKRAEQALRDSEQHLRRLAETLPQLVWTCLPDGNCDYLSSQWVAYTGIPEREQLGFHWLDMVMHPDDRERTYAA